MTELSAKQIADIVGGQLYGDGSVRVTSVCTDSRKAEKNDLFTALKGERFDGNDYLSQLDGRVGAAIAERTAQVSYPIILVKDSLAALTALSKYYAKNIIHPDITVSLTGSVGKTTTKEMVSSVLSSAYKTAYTKGNFNNHIGVPLTLLSAEADDKALVCEMGMNHKGELEHLSGLVDSDVALITNIGHSHIENLGSREGIRDAKLEILTGLKKNGTLIINGDEPLLENPPFDGKVITVGLTDKCDLWADNIEMGEDNVIYTLHSFGKTSRIELSCTGRHNVVNSLFAIATGMVAGIEPDKIQSGLLNYKSVGLRQNIYIKNGVRVIADCYNAGIESMTASLKMMSELKCDGRRVAVLSDMLELGEISEEAHRSVGLTVAECKTDMLFTVGNAALFICEEAISHGTKATHFDTKQQLADELRRFLKEGDTVLFKASHSMKLEEVISIAGLEK